MVQVGKTINNNEESSITTLISIINFGEVENSYWYFLDLIIVENLIKQFKENKEKFKEKKNNQSDNFERQYLFRNFSNLFFVFSE